MDKDDTIVRVGSGCRPRYNTRARSRRPDELRRMPVLTTFDLPDADYAAARAAFLQMKDDAWTKVDKIKTDLGEKWDDVTGKKK